MTSYDTSAILTLRYSLFLNLFQVLPDEAQPYWQDQFELSATVCSHAYWRGNCKRTSVGLSCEVGVRCRTYHILGGSVLGCWTKVEAVLASLPGGHASRMQIIRIRTAEGERIVGEFLGPLKTHKAQRVYYIHAFKDQH